MFSWVQVQGDVAYESEFSSASEVLFPHQYQGLNNMEVRLGKGLFMSFEDGGRPTD